MTHVTCRLTAKNQDQLRNPTLINRVWATFTFLTYSILAYVNINRIVKICRYATAAAIYSLGNGLRTFTAVPRWTQLSTLCGTVK